MKSIIFLLSLLLAGPIIHAQCGENAYRLFNQAQIDSFPRQANYCKEIWQLEIDARNGRITNLDSLYFIEKVSLFLTIRNDSTLRSVDGLKNLRYALQFQLSLYHDDWYFPNLDTVAVLRLSALRPELDLSTFRNVKTFGTLNLINDMHYSGLRDFTALGTGIAISLNSNTIHNTLENLIPIDISDNPVTLSLGSCQNLDTKGMEGLNLQRLGLANIYPGNVDFRALDHVKKIHFFGIRNYEEYPINIDILPQLDTIEHLLIQGNKKNINLFEFVKNVKHVSTKIHFLYNENLENIEWLDSLSLPHDTTEIRYWLDTKNKRVVLENNFDFDNCNFDFLCRALERYPDSVYMEGNGQKCTKEEVMRYCQKVNIQDEKLSRLRVYPNPTSHMIHIESQDPVLGFVMSDAYGRVLEKNENDQNHFDMSNYPPGVYFLRINIQGFIKTVKIVKIE